jgi:uncharacterized protein involved in response to NO
MSRSLVHGAHAPRREAALPILAKGFRPFFLLAALHAVLFVPLWVLVLGGHVHVGGGLGSNVWHAHEMLFGFTSAVIAGFLLTAVTNWTGRETASGAPLAGLCLLWLAGRVLSLMGHGFAAIADGAFFLGLCFAIGRPIVLARSKRNYLFPVLILALFFADAWLHFGATGSAGPGLRLGPLRAVDAVVVMMILVTARIVPMFTRSGLDDQSVHSSPRLDWLAVGGAVMLAILGAANLDERWLSLLALATGVLAFARAHAWRGHRTLRVPLLWILHAGHAFIGLGLVLRGLSGTLGVVPTSMWTHCLTAGGIGSLTLGMMSRVTLGHTGRMLAAPRPVAWGFVATVLGAVLRVVSPLFPALQLTLLSIAGMLWALGFLAFVLWQSPMLVAPRVDGRPG